MSNTRRINDFLIKSGPTSGREDNSSKASSGFS